MIRDVPEHLAQHERPNTSDYVLVERVHPEADGLKIQEQVLKSDLEALGLSLDDENVREAHPEANRPTSDHRPEERGS